MPISGLLRVGSQGQDVTMLQRALNARGARLDEDGDYGPRTAAAVREFQASNGADVDGVVGPQTLGLLGLRDEYVSPRPSPVVLPSTTGTERERWEMYASMVRRAGGEVCPNGQPTVLGVRTERASSRSYDDRYIVLTAGGRVRELAGATHPGQSRSSLSPDVTGDGVGDVGMIRPGNYAVVPNGPHGGAASFHVRTLDGSGALPGWRDTDHDGVYRDAEVSRSVARGDRVTGVLFHQGDTSSPRSIGCLTLPPDEYRRFLDAVGGSRARFSFTLVEI